MNRGLLTYAALNLTAWAVKVLTGGRVEPADYHLKEYWSLRNEDRNVQPWFVRAVKGEKFWEKQSQYDSGSDGESERV